LGAERLERRERWKMGRWTKGAAENENEAAFCFGEVVFLTTAFLMVVS
jgi:hypothetical protein